MIEMGLHIADETASADELEALVNLCIHTAFKTNGYFGDLSALRDVDPRTDANAGDWLTIFDQYTDGMMVGYAGFVRAKLTDGPAYLEEKQRIRARLNDPDGVQTLGPAVTLDQLMSELRRYRKSGPRTENRMLALGKTSLKDVVRFAIGDKVCNNGVLLRWSGTIVGTGDQVYEIRMDYVSSSFGRNYVRGKPYKLVQGEFKQKTSDSIDSLLDRLR